MSKALLLCALCVALCLTGCSTLLHLGKKAKAPPPVAENNPLIDLDTEGYEAAGLDYFWRDFLAPDDQVSKAFLAHKRLYVETKNYTLYSYDDRTGVRKWAYQMNNSLNYGVVYDTDQKDILYILVENIMIALDYDTGVRKWKRPLPFSISSEPVVDRLNFYAGASDMRLYALDKTTFYENWHFTTGSFVLSHPYIKDNFVYFGSNDGNVYCLGIGEGELAWKYPTQRPVSAGVVGAEDFIYVGSQDYNLYCLHTLFQGRQDKQVKWSYPTGSMILEDPLLIGKTVFVKTRDNGIFALDRDTGGLKWHLKDGRQFLMLGKRKAYILNDKYEIQVLDNETGMKYFRINVLDFDVFVINETSDILFLVKSGSHILALKEAGFEM